MDEVELRFCQKCLDDHEDRIRDLERNNTAEGELRILEGKVWAKFESNEKVYANRLDVLERYVTTQLAVINTQKEVHKDNTALLAIVISGISLIIVIIKMAYS
jgi:hypothetical protein